MVVTVPPGDDDGSLNYAIKVFLYIVIKLVHCKKKSLFLSLYFREAKMEEVLSSSINPLSTKNDNSYQ